MEALRVTSQTPEIESSKNSKQYVIYKFLVGSQNDEIYIYGRYSELLKMHERLMRHPKSRKVLQADKRGTAAQFPKKSWWYVDMTKPSNYNQRRAELLRYYELLYSNARLLTLDVFHEVMGHSVDVKRILRDLAPMLEQTRQSSGSHARKPRSSTTSSAGAGPAANTSSRQNSRRHHRVYFQPKQHPPPDEEEYALARNIDVSVKEVNALMRREQRCAPHIAPKAIEIDDGEKAEREARYARIMAKLGPPKLGIDSPMRRAMTTLPVSVYDLTSAAPSPAAPSAAPTSSVAAAHPAAARHHLPHRSSVSSATAAAAAAAVASTAAAAALVPPHNHKGGKKAAPRVLLPTPSEEVSRILQYLARPMPEYAGTRLAYRICDEVAGLMSLAKPDEIDGGGKNYANNYATGGGAPIHNAHYMTRTGAGGVGNGDAAAPAPVQVDPEATGDPNALIAYLIAPRKDDDGI